MSIDLPPGNIRPGPRIPSALPRLSMLLLVLLLAVAFPRPGHAAYDEAKPAGPPILVGANYAYPPYEFLDANGHPAGYNVDLTRAIAEVMGVKVEFRFGTWSRLRDELRAGRVDILQGMSFSDDRTHEVDFSPPHTIVHHAIFARRGTKVVTTLEELRGKKVVVFKGGIMHDSLVRLGLGPELVLAKSPADALRLLAAGGCEYAVVAALPGMSLISQLHLTNVVPVARSVAAEKYCYAVRKGNTELLTRFSEGLAILEQTGQYQAIYDKWLGVHEQPRLSRDRALKYGLAVLLPLLGVLAGTAVWSRTLQRRVADRTAELAQEVAERNRALEELKRHQDKLIQADKMATLGTLVAGVAHEVNNPNGLILLNLPILRDVFRDTEETLEERYQKEGDFPLGGIPYSRMREEVPKMLEEMGEGASRIKRIVEDLKDYARQDTVARKEPFDLNDVVQKALRLLEPTLRKSTSRFSTQFAENLPPALGVPQRIEQVIVNLLVNACQALPAPDRAIRLATSYDPEQALLRVSIRDEGVGIPQEFLNRLTDPFFTTKRESGGTGLGLSISAGIVQEHGGSLSFDSPPGGGTTAVLSLPTGPGEQQ
ncbi:transporter substrate-binding domain-containing protein [Geomesophilobacter sediminis]|uniref:histidine kinase n=1 Tax=Geomesophilobacter sediminis TaxID=2798584 RepID=A0A8J7M0R6_9BACT|nr:transporter substrate-binding domain-containing protein [Geomesophilobacter sediminis]MBJ6726478.1 transporter substrate-binding domain-containing protein [Geomesophilobacter sediminis]